METKVCRLCGKELPYEAFSRKKDTSDGLQSYCRTCNSEYNRLRYQAFKTACEMGKQNIESNQNVNNKLPEPTPQVVEVKSSKPLEEISSRDLLSELKSRGYVWEKMYIKKYVEYSKI